MKKITLLLFIVFPLIVFSQQHFLPGYYINNDGSKISGFIENENWYDAPQFIYFKPSPDGEVVRLNTEVIKEFSLGDDIKYIRQVVKYDANPIVMLKRSEIDHSRPEMTLGSLLLKVLIEGKATLYCHGAGENQRFFYQLPDKEITQLIYKKFYNRDVKERENNEFRTQLFTELNCDNAAFSKFSGLEYNQTQLRKAVSDFNSCNNTEVKVFHETDKPTFRIAPYVGVIMSKHDLSAGISGDLDNISTVDVALGVEFALQFPYKRSRFEIFARAGIQTMKIEQSVRRDLFASLDLYYIYNIEYNNPVINMALGPRVNFDLDFKNRIFADVSAGLIVPFGELTITRDRHSLNQVIVTDKAKAGTVPTVVFNAGIGYEWNKKFGIDFRAYLSSIEVFDDNELDFNSKTTSFAMTFKYVLK